MLGEDGVIYLLITVKRHKNALFTKKVCKSFGGAKVL